MKRTVRILRRAERDLQLIYDEAVHERPLRADAFIDRILDRIASLATMGERGSVPRDPALAARGYRFVVVGSYLAFYKVGRGQIRVYRVLHGHRAYRDLL